MTEERIQLLEKAKLLYTTTNTSIAALSQQLEIPKGSITSYFKKENIEIKAVHGAHSKLKEALEQYPFKTLEEISKETGILVEALQIALNTTNSKAKKQLIQLAKEEYINTPLLDRSAAEISQKYGINRKTLIKYLKEDGIEVVNTGSAVSFNDTAFDVIDSEEKAYWLGFMYADGCVTKTGNAVALSLSLKDVKHLEKFNEFLKYPKGLNVTLSHLFGSKETTNKNGEPIYMVSTTIKNPHLHLALCEKGCIPNKSLILRFPTEDMVPKELIHHFIRGYFDGDGNLGLYKHSATRNNLEESLMFVGTEHFLKGVENILGKGFLMHKTNCADETFRLSYSTSKAFHAADLMYNNATIYLERKYNIYKSFCAARKSSKIGKSCDANTEVNLEITQGS